MIRLLFLLSLLFVLGWFLRTLAQKWRAKLRGQPLTGRLVEHHPNGRPKTERHVQDGMLHGPWITWDPQGNKVAEGVYHRGIVHGLEIDYAPNGVKKREVNWVNGRRHGLAQEYAQDGQVVRALTYVHAMTDEPRHEGPPTSAELGENPKD